MGYDTVLSLLGGQLFESDAGPEKSAIRTPRDDARIGATFKSRGDKTAIELFVAGVRGWEAGLRRFLAPSADGK